MTKSEYMQALQEKLQNYNPALAQEILEDYEMHFAEGLAAGHSEEEIIRELGSVDDMLREFSEEDLKKEMEIAEARTNEVKQFESLYRAVVIDGLLADVSVSASQDGRLNVSYENNSTNAMKLRYRFYQYEKNGTFYAGVEDTGVIKKQGVFPYIGHFGRNIHLSVEIPSGIPAVKISAQSGDLQVEHLNLSGETRTKMELLTSSGDIKATGVSGESLSLQSSSGDIEGKNIHCNQFSAASASGDIELKLAAETCDIHTASGDIDLEVTAEIKPIRLKADSQSGDIKFDCRQVTGAAIEVNTVSGDVNIRGVKSSNRHYNPSYGDGSCKITVNTTSGDIEII